MPKVKYLMTDADKRRQQLEKAKLVIDMARARYNVSAMDMVEVLGVSKSTLRRKLKETSFTLPELLLLSDKLLHLEKDDWLTMVGWKEWPR